jgi:hypothetical protein
LPGKVDERDRVAARLEAGLVSRLSEGEKDYGQHEERKPLSDPDIIVHVALPPVFYQKATLKPTKSTNREVQFANIQSIR